MRLRWDDVLDSDQSEAVLLEDRTVLCNVQCFRYKSTAVPICIIENIGQRKQ